MQFFKQISRNDCQITALKTVLSFFNEFPTDSMIRKDLPKHGKNNYITELGSYLENKGIKTMLISNKDVCAIKNDKFVMTLEEYCEIGKFEDRLVLREDVKDKPIIVNVDWYKSKRVESKRRSAHYVVLLKEGSESYMYDGGNYSEPIKVTFEGVSKMSENINRLKWNGMWLVII